MDHEIAMEWWPIFQSKYFNNGISPPLCAKRIQTKANFVYLGILLS